MNTIINVFKLAIDMVMGNKPKTIVLYRNDEFMPKDNLARVFLKIK